MPAKQDTDVSVSVKVLKLFLILLSDGEKHYQTDLTLRLKCSPQTVRRLAEEIERVVGESLETQREGKQRYYRLRPLKPNRHLIAQQINAQDLRYLAICRELADAYLPDQVKESLDRALLEFSVHRQEMLPPHNNSDPLGHFRFYSKGYIDYTPHYATITALLNLIDNEGLCLVEYRAAGREHCRTHCFSPSQFLSMSGTLYVFGAILDVDRKTRRHLTYFAVHRIQNVTVLEGRRHFAIPEDDPREFGLTWHDPVTYHIDFEKGAASDYIRERVFAAHQILTEREDGGVTLTLTTCSTPEIVAFVRSFGPAATLRDEHRQAITDLDSLTKEVRKGRH